jgi:hypothetical protein
MPRALDSGDAVVRITQFVASSDYDDQAASRDIVLATLSTSGGVSQTTSSSAPGGPRTSHRDSSKGTATSTAATAPLDLPAMALLPSDIDPNAGMENSRALSFDAFVKWVADATSPDVEAPNLSQSALRLVIDSYF